MSQVIQNSSNYISYDGHLSKVRYHRVPLSNVSSNSLAISLSSVNLGEFRLTGGQVYNLGKSYIAYNYTVQATASKYNCVHEVGNDLCNWIYFGDGFNVGLTDIQYADRYSKAVRTLRCPKDEFESLDRENGSYRSGELASVNVLPFSRDGVALGTQNACTNDYDEVKYLRIAPNVNQALTVNRFLPLSSFKDSFIGMDKNMFFPREMFLRFNTQHANRICFQAVNPSNPHISATEIASGDAPPKFLNLYLYLAVETNEVLIDQIKSKVMSSGLRMSIPFQYAYRFTTQAGATSSSIQITLTQQFGRKLKRMLTLPFNGNGEKSEYSYDHSNVNGTKVNTVRSSLDSVPIVDYIMNCFNPEDSINPAANWTFPNAAGTDGGSIGNDDYREARLKLMGSAMSSYSEYQTNWFYCDDWGMNPMLKKESQSVDDSDIDDGLSLIGNNKIYNIQFENVFAGTSTNNMGGSNGLIVYYIFAYFVRDLMINQDGVQWV